MKKQNSFIRQQTTICGSEDKPAEYFEQDFYTVTAAQHKATPKAKRALASSVAQQRRNEKHSKRWLTQILNTNFGPRDLHVTLDYADDHVPKDGETADKQLGAWLRKIRDRCKFQNLPAPLYVGVTEWRPEDSPDGPAVRPHHHVALKCALTRDELELLWNTGGKGCGAKAPLDELRKCAELLGTACNADRLHFEHGSLAALANYITKAPTRRHKWHYSRGLKQPITPRPNDTKYTHKSLERIIRQRLDDREYWRAVYPGWELGAVEAQYNDFTGWALHMEFYKPHGGGAPLSKVKCPPPEKIDAVLAQLCGVEPAELKTQDALERLAALKAGIVKKL